MTHPMRPRIVALIDDLLRNAFEEYSLEIKFAEALRRLPKKYHADLPTIMLDRIKWMVDFGVIDSEVAARVRHDGIVHYLMERARWADTNSTDVMLDSRRAGSYDVGLLDTDAAVDELHAQEEAEYDEFLDHKFAELDQFIQSFKKYQKKQ